MADDSVEEKELFSVVFRNGGYGNKTTDRSIIDAIDMDYNTCIVWKSFVAYG